MRCQIEGIFTALRSVKDSGNVLAAAFKCDWYDEVHEAFRPYISSSKEHISAIDEQVNLCRTICDSLNTIDVDKIIANVQEIILQERNF